jgi:hypothetical protein
MKNLNKHTSEAIRSGNENGSVYRVREVNNQPIIAEKPDIPVPKHPQTMGFASVELVKSSQTELQP